MGIFDAVGGALFGKSGSVQQEMLSPEQLAARNAQSQALRNAVVNSGGALAGHTGTAFNPYDSAMGDQQFDRSNAFLEEDRLNNQSALKAGPMNRFSMASAKMSGDINNNYARNRLASDQARLQARTSGLQQGYGNQMQAIQNALGGNQGTLGNTTQIQNTKSTGLLDVLGGVGGAVNSVKGLIGGW